MGIKYSLYNAAASPLRSCFSPTPLFSSLFKIFVCNYFCFQILDFSKSISFFHVSVTEIYSCKISLPCCCRRLKSTVNLLQYGAGLHQGIVLIIKVAQAEWCNEILLDLLNHTREKGDLLCFNVTTALDCAHCDNLLVAVQDHEGETSQGSNSERTKGAALCGCALTIVEQFRLNQCSDKDVS